MKSLISHCRIYIACESGGLSLPDSFLPWRHQRVLFSKKTSTSCWFFLHYFRPDCPRPLGRPFLCVSHLPMSQAPCTSDMHSQWPYRMLSCDGEEVWEGGRKNLEVLRVKLKVFLLQASHAWGSGPVGPWLRSCRNCYPSMSFAIFYLFLGEKDIFQKGYLSLSLSVFTFFF